MKISPEPKWGSNNRREIGSRKESIRKMLRAALSHCAKAKTNNPILVSDHDGRPLGSFTPEFFLDLTRREQLKFLSAARGMHDRGVDR